MKQGNSVLKTLLLLALCACLILPLYAAAKSGVEVDDEGGTWDYDNNVYTDPDGNKYPITPEGVPDSDSNPTTPPSQNPDGGIEVGGDDEIPDLPGPDPTRAPIEGDDWDALLDSVAARNGSSTPTIYRNPATGEVSFVEVKYMGIGRSMVVLGGQETLVNTVDLKWQTEAPEDKVLAVVDAPRVGYAWMRRGPNNKITNPKIRQIRTDSVMRVVSAGETWTLVDYDGMRGYVQSASLEFFYNDHTDFDAALLSVKGRTKGNDIVHVRSRDKGCRDLGEYKLGTPVTLFDIIDEWAEVDIAGWHCRVLAKYITME